MTRVIVVDASLVVEALTPSTHTRLAREALEEAASHSALIAPHGVFQVEVLNGFRKALLRGAVKTLTPLLEALEKLPIRLVTLDKLLVRLTAEIVALTQSPAPDAVYVALAHVTHATLYTLDAGQASIARRVLGEERVYYLPATRRNKEGEGS